MRQHDVHHHYLPGTPLARSEPVRRHEEEEAPGGRRRGRAGEERKRQQKG